MHEVALDAAVELAKPFEGLRLAAYRCPAGVWTVGWGHTGPEVVEGYTIDLQQASGLLYADMRKAVSEALAYCPRLATASPLRLAAVSDFCFNLGGGRLKASTLRQKINNDDWDAVPGELRKWVWAAGRKLPGLILRREAEISLVRQAV